VPNVKITRFIWDILPGEQYIRSKSTHMLYRFGRESWEHDVLHDDTGTGGKIQARENVERFRSVYATCM
jgi:hypothetical protein